MFSLFQKMTATARVHYLLKVKTEKGMKSFTVVPDDLYCFNPLRQPEMRLFERMLSGDKALLLPHSTYLSIFLSQTVVSLSDSLQACYFLW